MARIKILNCGEDISNKMRAAQMPMIIIVIIITRLLLIIELVIAELQENHFF